MILKESRVVDDAGGLWQRTVDELDATAAAYAAYTLAQGTRRLGGGPARGRDRPARPAPGGPLRQAAAAAPRAARQRFSTTTVVDLISATA